MSLIVPPSMEGLWSRRGHVGPGNGAVTYARDLVALQLCPHVRVSLQHTVLRKKKYELRTSYLASYVQADVLE